MESSSGERRRSNRTTRGKVPPAKNVLTLVDGSSPFDLKTAPKVAGGRDDNVRETDEHPLAALPEDPLQVFSFQMNLGRDTRIDKRYSGSRRFCQAFLPGRIDELMAAFSRWFPEQFKDAYPLSPASSGSTTYRTALSKLWQQGAAKGTNESPSSTLAEVFGRGEEPSETSGRKRKRNDTDDALRLKCDLVSVSLSRSQIKELTQLDVEEGVVQGFALVAFAPGLREHSPDVPREANPENLSRERHLHRAILEPMIELLDDKSLTRPRLKESLEAHFRISELGSFADGWTSGRKSLVERLISVILAQTKREKRMEALLDFFDRNLPEKDDAQALQWPIDRLSPEDSADEATSREGAPREESEDPHSEQIQDATTLGYIFPQFCNDHPLGALGPHLLERNMIQVQLTAALQPSFISSAALNRTASEFLAEQSLQSLHSRACAAAARSPLNLEGHLECSISLEPRAFEYGTRRGDDGFVDGRDGAAMACRGQMNPLISAILKANGSRLSLKTSGSYWTNIIDSFYSFPPPPPVPQLVTSSALTVPSALKKGKKREVGPTGQALVASTSEVTAFDDPTSLPFDNSVAHLLEACRPPKGVAEAPQPSLIRTPLLPYQKRAVNWMVRKETPAPQRKKEMLMAGWVEINIDAESKDEAVPVAKKGKRNASASSHSSGITHFYMDECTGALSLRRFEQRPMESGGLLADQMGLGKTVELLALVAANPMPTSPSLYSRSWKLIKDLPEKTRPTVSGATLIVVPESIAEQWMVEIGRHWNGDKSRVLKLNKNTFAWDRNSTREELHSVASAILASNDIVLVTYEYLRSELRKSSRCASTNMTKSPRSPLLEIHWWRIVLDEAQMIGQSNGSAAASCNELFRENGWLTTGTPITKEIDDLYGLLVFLDHDPLASARHFEKLLQTPFKTGESLGIYRMRSLLSSFTWRNTSHSVKDELTLPPNGTVWLDVKMSGLELTIYNKEFERAKQEVIKKVCKKQMPDEKLLTNLRQLINHPQVAGGFQGAYRLSFTQLFDQLIAKHERLLRNHRMNLVTITLQIVFGAEFYCAETDKSKWAAGPPPAEREIEQLKSVGLSVAEAAALKEREDQEQRLAEEGAEPTGAALMLPTTEDEEGEAEPNETQDGAVGSAQQDDGTRMPGKKGTGVEHSTQLTFKEAIYWLRKSLYPSETQAEARFDPERPSQLFFEKRWRVARDEDKDDPRFHIVELDAGEDDLPAEGEYRDTFEDPALKKNRLRGGAKGRNEVRGWYYHPRSKFATLRTALLEAHNQLHTTLQETRFLYSRKEDASADHETADAAGRLAQQRTCPICFEEEHAAAVLGCLHSFCIDCIDRIAETPRPTCPTCRRPFTREQVAKVTIKTPEPEDESDANATVGDYGAKIRGLIQDLRKRLGTDVSRKAVIFSHFRKFLHIVQEALLINNIGAVRLGGTEQEQSEALSSFREKGRARVLLVPMRASEGAAGLTLTMAQYAYLLEPGLDPGLEAQAKSRISRIGQTEPTTVVRVRMLNTIEEGLIRFAEGRTQADNTTGLELKDGFTMDQFAGLFDVNPAQEQEAVRAARARAREERENEWAQMFGAGASSSSG